jgi:hypothetical protein
MKNASCGVIAAVVCCALLTPAAFGQGSTGRRVGDPNFVVTRTVSEPILSINSNAGQMTMKDWDGKQHTVTITKDTKFPTNTQFRDLREGQWIRYTYRLKDAVAVEIRPEDHPPSGPRK